MSLPFGHHGNLVGAERDRPLDNSGELTPKLTEVSSKDVAVVGVHDQTLTGSDPCRVVQDRRQTTENASLGGVGVRDIGLYLEDLPSNRKECLGVRPRAQPSAQAGDLPSRQAALGDQMGQGSLSRLRLAVKEKRSVPTIAQAGVEHRHMSGGTSDVQPGNHTHDPQRPRVAHVRHRDYSSSSSSSPRTIPGRREAGGRARVAYASCTA